MASRAASRPGGQSGSQGQQAGGGSQGGQQASAGGRQQQEGSRELRQAAGEMADAAKDLSRQDLEEARRRSARTLDRLRQLERRLGGEAVPDDRRRRFGELELEARLLAEAQKRLADAARQQAGARAGGSPSASTGQSGSQGQRAGASGGGAGSRDADRRLAQEQESLAARAEALEKQLSLVNRAEAGDAAASAAVGARAELARGKPGEDMRKAADAMRRGAGGAEGATREAAAARSRSGPAARRRRWPGPRIGWAARAVDATRRGSPISSPGCARRVSAPRRRKRRSARRSSAR